MQASIMVAPRPNVQKYTPDDAIDLLVSMRVTQTKRLGNYRANAYLREAFWVPFPKSWVCILDKLIIGVLQERVI
jgi:hypothetical protein